MVTGGWGGRVAAVLGRALPLGHAHVTRRPVFEAGVRVVRAGGGGQRRVTVEVHHCLLHHARATAAAADGREQAAQVTPDVPIGPLHGIIIVSSEGPSSSSSSGAHTLLLSVSGPSSLLLQGA